MNRDQRTLLFWALGWRCCDPEELRVGALGTQRGPGRVPAQRHVSDCTDRPPAEDAIRGHEFRDLHFPRRMVWCLRFGSRGL